MHLSHTTQCKTCPWRVEASLEDIPSYDRLKHENLEESCNQSGISSLVFSCNDVPLCQI